MENRKEAPATAAQYQQAVRGRLLELKERYGLSEIARRTRTPLTNVHRYMNEGKVPSEFCAALVDAFEINPAWLLTGAGGALLSEVDPGTAKLGGNLLELVNAMNAVSRMRLGALAGKEQEKKLRELGEALDTYERLRERMNAQTRPILAELIQRFARHNSAMQLDRAAGVRKAALQVSRFCDDEELLYDLDRLQAYHEHVSGRIDAALAFHQRLFARNLRRGAITTAAACDEAGSYVMALRDSGRFHEGLRVSEAAILLATGAARECFQFDELDGIAGSFEVELSDVASGLARIQRALLRLEPARRPFLSILRARAELLAGLTTISEVRDWGYPARGRTRLLMRQASLAEDAAAVKWLVRDWISEDEAHVPATEYEARRATLIEAMLAGRKGKHFEAYQALLDETPPPVNAPVLREMMAQIHLAQAARLCGDRSAASLTLHAEKLVKGMSAELFVPADLQGLHARNVREALPGSKHAPLRKEWEEFLVAKVRAGYGFLRHFQERG